MVLEEYRSRSRGWECRSRALPSLRRPVLAQRGTGQARSVGRSAVRVAAGAVRFFTCRIFRVVAQGVYSGSECAVAQDGWAGGYKMWLLRRSKSTAAKRASEGSEIELDFDFEVLFGSLGSIAWTRLGLDRRHAACHLK